MILYPLIFEPILVEKIWGGQKIKKILHKKTNLKTNIGESWEISSIPGKVSLVSNGKLKGSSLNSLIKKYRSDLLGDRVYRQFGNIFPLLIKFIDVKSTLSVQLHPDDKLAHKRHNSFGKTEMWYIMDANSDAKIHLGFKEFMDKKTYLKHMGKKTILDFINTDIAKKGEIYYVPAGKIHSIGNGVLLAEIQQTSDITYRVYDWGRFKKTGMPRKLHLQESIDAIDYSDYKNYKIKYKQAVNTPKSIIDSKYFSIKIIAIEKSVMQINYVDLDSFVVYICVEGSVKLEYENKSIDLQIGQTILIPASLSKFKISSFEKASLLEVFIP